MRHDESYGDLWRRNPLRVGLAKKLYSISDYATTRIHKPIKF